MNIIELQTILQNRFDKYEWSVPPDLNLGILTTNYAFRAKDINPNPKEAAIKIAELVQKHCDDLSLDVVVRSVGPYVNVEMGEKEYRELFDSNYGFKLERKAERLLIDYFSPNVGKKMHVGHIRSADIGETLRRILSLKYETVISNNHLGDWGIQFGMLIWGLRNLESKDLYTGEVKSQTYYNIYVRVNELCESDSNIKKECQVFARILENFILGKINFDEYKQDLVYDIFDEYFKITDTSLGLYSQASSYLNLNKSVFSKQGLGQSELFDIYLRDYDHYSREILFSPNFKDSVGLHQINEEHENEQFDLTLGESFYIKYIDVFEDLVEVGIAIKEGHAIYVDLESEGLGRCYLISSEGYSLYHSRDIIARFVWAGLLEADKMLTLADNRQSHSFKQVFAIIKKILNSKLYESKNFASLTKIETQRALNILKLQSPEHVGFGFMTLPDGAMSTRKGKIVAFDELKDTLELRVKEVLSEKSGIQDNQLIRKVSVASLKWVDLYRDRDQDVVFDFKQFLSFEGNTGVYQLYTVARINSILKKNTFGSELRNDDLEFDLDLLNSDEKILLKKMYILPLILEQICVSYKPHLLCNHLFELATLVNSWYVKFSVSNEQNLDRKKALICMCLSLKKCLYFGLDLLGIEAVDEM